MNRVFVDGATVFAGRVKSTWNCQFPYSNQVVIQCCLEEAQ
jgi:hypothetical protein